MGVQVGDVRRLSATFTADSVATDPSAIYLHIKDPSGNISTLTYSGGDLTKSSTGIYTYDILLDEPGKWFYKWVGTGTVIASTPDIDLDVEETSFTYPPS